MFRSTLLPEELTHGYCGDLRLMNQQVTNMMMPREAANQLGLNMPTEHCGRSAVLAAIAGMSLEQVVHHHTLAKFMRAPRGRAGQAESQLNKAADHLSTYRKRARFCIACQKEDREFHGRAYYRRYHQLPGIWWCTKHENAVLHVTPEGEAAYEQPPDFWVNNGSRQVAFQLKTFSKAHRTFLLTYMSLCEGIMTWALDLASFRGALSATLIDQIISVGKL